LEHRPSKIIPGIIFLIFVAAHWMVEAVTNKEKALMPSRSIIEIMDAMGGFLDDFDRIARDAHTRYRAYNPADLIELDVRAQAACTYAHMVAGADRRFDGRANVRPVEIRGLKVWLIQEPNVVVRLKKMDENGSSRSYPTKQAKAFDAGEELPNLPMPPVRLTVGYLLDQTGSEFVRSQVARPDGRSISWCAAIVPQEEREVGKPVWIDVTKQPRFG
jgi:hypothetical protein